MTELFYVRRFDHLHAGVAHEFGQRRYFGAGGSADAPRGFKNPAPRLAVDVKAKADVVVSTRGHKPGICVHRLVIESCLGNAGANGIGQREAIERIPSSPDADEVRSAINESLFIIGRNSLPSMVGEAHVINHDVADAQCRNVLQIFFED